MASTISAREQRLARKPTLALHEEYGFHDYTLELARWAYTFANEAFRDTYEEIKYNPSYGWWLANRRHRAMLLAERLSKAEDRITGPFVRDSKMFQPRFDVRRDLVLAMEKCGLRKKAKRGTAMDSEPGQARTMIYTPMYRNPRLAAWRPSKNAETRREDSTYETNRSLLDLRVGWSKEAHPLGHMLRLSDWQLRQLADLLSENSHFSQMDLLCFAQTCGRLYWALDVKPVHFGLSTRTSKVFKARLER